MNLRKLNVQPTALLAELVGTFLLTLVVVTVANPLIVGFTLVTLVFGLAVVSGAHLNPAITLALWTVRKLEGVKVPFYLVMQFAGALLALLVIQTFQTGDMGLSLGSFTEFDTKIVVAELLGAMTFAFAFAAAWTRNLSESARALCVGLGLLTGLAVGGGLLGQALQSTASSNNQNSRLTLVDGVVLNPAVSLAVSEKDQQQNPFSQNAQVSTDRQPSRFTLETIVGSVVGALLGANLYMVLNGINPLARKTAAASTKTTTRVVKKSSTKRTTRSRK